MKKSRTIKVNSITQFHELRGLPRPQHPLISVVDYRMLKSFSKEPVTLIANYYIISIKRGVNKIHYGQQKYDFDEGVLYFLAPNQLLRIESDPEEDNHRSGWMFLIHPDFLWNTALAQKIHTYEYFGYAVNEALFLSNKEESIINNVVLNIQQEYHSKIDKFTQSIIVSQIETLLNYAQRFYERQFITRKIDNHHILARLEKLLNNYFSDNFSNFNSLPTVQSVSEKLHVSPNYLTGLLKSLTGQTTQQHIHNKLIDKAKEKLSSTDLSISEIAYELGFEHSQAFSRLFKSKTNKTPLDFRNSFN